MFFGSGHILHLCSDVTSAKVKQKKLPIITSTTLLKLGFWGVVLATGKREGDSNFFLFDFSSGGALRCSTQSTLVDEIPRPPHTTMDPISPAPRAHSAGARAPTSPVAALAAFVCTFALSPAKSALDVVCSHFQGNNTHGNEHGVGPMDTPEAACFDKLNVSLGMAHDGDRPMNLDSPTTPIFSPWSHPDGVTDDVDADGSGFAPARLRFPAEPAGEEVTEDPKNAELRGEGFAQCALQQLLCLLGAALLPNPLSSKPCHFF